MTDGLDEQDQRLREIDRRAASSDGSGRRKVIGGAVLALLLGGGALLLLLPEGSVRQFLGFGTSDVRSVQEPMPPSVGVDTALPRAPLEAPAAPLDTTVLRPSRAPDGLGPEDQARIASLEEQLRALRARETGVSAADLKAMLDANAAQMRSEMNRMLLARRPVTAGIDPSAGHDAEARKRMEEERARRAAIEEAQVKSRGLVLDGGSADGQMIAEDGAGGRRSANESFLASASSAGHETARATDLADPSRMIVQGTILEGVLEIAMSTDLPGAIRAVLSQDVLSYDGSNVLLPRGSRLIGTYSSDVRIAQRRALVAWNRAITPDGTSVALGGFGADALGRSGQTGQVDTHFWERFGSAALISIFGLAPQVIVSDSTNGDAADAVEDVGDDLRAATSGALDAYLRIAPTINVDQGDRITVFVNRDLMF